ncbi:peptidyl-trna hydrolase-like protein [Stylonychia lemnae]|uniref:peptidyl-tRNA hydrolase n=1 Tax=Stylonychia lemnae TaxID=5949 RepID=A0A078AEU7_STYLE|nr:peptidyl-trna hydrolase-like protein [Stylonychia lemnae]|eukprot:CDW79408.1 peptidyl-trna hydrolase-like protein [Stylonychia lemnae]
MYKNRNKKEKRKKRGKKLNKTNEEEGEEQESDWIDDDSEEDQNEDGSKRIKDEVLTIQYPIQDVKMVLIVREDLKMGKGKVGAQCGHATLGVYKQVQKYAKDSEYWQKVLSNWSWEGQKKICLKVTSEQELLDLQSKAKEKSIPAYVVADAGLTQIKEGSLTVCGLGPAPTKMINILTGHLKLL